MIGASLLRMPRVRRLHSNLLPQRYFAGSKRHSRLSRRSTERPLGLDLESGDHALAAAWDVPEPRERVADLERKTRDRDTSAGYSHAVEGRSKTADRSLDLELRARDGPSIRLDN